jgi:THO complex subunit 1
MPSATVQGHGVPAVVACASFLHDTLDRAEQIKDTPSIEPPLTKSDLGDVSAQVTALFDDVLGAQDEGQADQRKLRQYAIFETAARDLFSELIVRSPRRSLEPTPAEPSSSRRRRSNPLATP